jgi:hypothetical protein
MNIDPFVLIQKGDIVELNSEGLSYFGEEFAGKMLEVVETKIDEIEKKSCTHDNDGIERPNCTCYRDFNLRPLGTDKVIKWARFEEITLKEIR